MKRTRTKTDAAAARPAKRRRRARLAGTGEENERDGGSWLARRVATAEADRTLVDAALAGSLEAWEKLYAGFHDPLMAAIRMMLRGRADTNVVEELAARVWYAVVKEEGKLLRRFDPSRGCRLTTFLAKIAKDEAACLFRSERRRRRREAESSMSAARLDEVSVQASSVTMSEFEATLTASERSYYEEMLRSSKDLQVESVTPRSQANQWQLRHRVRRKLQQFLDD